MGLKVNADEQLIEYTDHFAKKILKLQFILRGWMYYKNP